MWENSLKETNLLGQSTQRKVSKQSANISSLSVYLYQTKYEAQRESRVTAAHSLHSSRQDDKTELNYVTFVKCDDFLAFSDN